MFNTLFKFKTGNNDLNVDVSGIDLEKVPQHIAIIMDGNGRWAKARGKTGATDIRRALYLSVKSWKPLQP